MVGGWARARSQWGQLRAVAGSIGDVRGGECECRIVGTLGSPDEYPGAAVNRGGRRFNLHFAGPPCHATPLAVCLQALSDATPLSAARQAGVQDLVAAHASDPRPPGCQCGAWAGCPPAHKSRAHSSQTTMHPGPLRLSGPAGLAARVKSLKFGREVMGRCPLGLGVRKCLIAEESSLLPVLPPSPCLLGHQQHSGREVDHVDRL